MPAGDDGVLLESSEVVDAHGLVAAGGCEDGEVRVRDAEPGAGGAGGAERGEGSEGGHC